MREFWVLFDNDDDDDNKDEACSDEGNNILHWSWGKTKLTVSQDNRHQVFYCESRQRTEKSNKQTHVIKTQIPFFEANVWQIYDKIYLCKTLNGIVHPA